MTFLMITLPAEHMAGRISNYVKKVIDGFIPIPMNTLSSVPTNDILFLTPEDVDVSAIDKRLGMVLKNHNGFADIHVKQFDEVLHLLDRRNPDMPKELAATILICERDRKITNILS